MKCCPFRFALDDPQCIGEDCAMFLKGVCSISCLIFLSNMPDRESLAKKLLREQAKAL